MKIVVFDDIREFKPDSEWVSEGDTVEYYKNIEEFSVFLAAEKQNIENGQPSVDVLVMDHDIYVEPFWRYEDTIKSCQQYTKLLEQLPLEQRPTVVVVSVNPGGAENIYQIFNDICIDVWKDYDGKTIQMTSALVM